MQTLETGLVIGANRYKINARQTGAALYLLQEAPVGDDANPNLTGLEIKKIGMPYPLYDELRGRSLPALHELIVEHERGGGDEDRLSVVSFKPIGLGDDHSALLSMFGGAALPTGPRPGAPDLSKPMAGAASCLCVSATRYDMTEEGGGRGGRVYAIQAASGRNADQLGIEVLKIRISYDLFDTFAAKRLPGEFILKTQLERGAGDKARVRVSAITSENLLYKDRLLGLFGIKSQTKAAA